MPVVQPGKQVIRPGEAIAVRTKREMTVRRGRGNQAGSVSTNNALKAIARTNHAQLRTHGRHVEAAVGQAIVLPEAAVVVIAEHAEHVVHRVFQCDVVAARHVWQAAHPLAAGTCLLRTPGQSQGCGDAATTSK